MKNKYYEAGYAAANQYDSYRDILDLYDSIFQEKIGESDFGWGDFYKGHNDKLKHICQERFKELNVQENIDEIAALFKKYSIYTNDGMVTCKIKGLEFNLQSQDDELIVMDGSVYFTGE